MIPIKTVRRLFEPTGSPWRPILIRVYLALAITALVAAVFWFLRDGLEDSTNPGNPLDLLDVIYFTIVTLTTIGYGDIVPVSQGARLFNTFGVVPLRVLIWIIFLSTIYLLVLREWYESFRLSMLKRRLKDHTIICGFGVKGRSAAEEMMDRGVPEEQIIVVDPFEEATAAAVELGLHAIKGDAGRESVLVDAGIRTASTVVVAPNHDRAGVLVCLTVKDLNPKVRIIVAAREIENARLLYRSGADVVITPSATGGRLLAAATVAPVSVTFFEDLLHGGEGVILEEQIITDNERGMKVSDLDLDSGTIVVGLKTDGERLNFDRIGQRELEVGDVVVLLKATRLA